MLFKENRVRKNKKWKKLYTWNPLPIGSSCPATIKFSSTFYKRWWVSRGQSPRSPAAAGEIPIPQGAFLKSEFEIFRGKISKRKTFCKKKSFSSSFLLPSVSDFPTGKSELPGAHTGALLQAIIECWRAHTMRPHK